MTTARVLQAARSSRLFGDDEPVFGTGHELVDGVAIPVFGQTDRWLYDCVRRPSNAPRAAWRVLFTQVDPVWNLRARELAFCMFNPAHRKIRSAGIALVAEPSATRTVTQNVYRVGLLAAWAMMQGVPGDLSHWDEDDWCDYLDHVRRSRISIRHTLTMLGLLSDLSLIFTDGGPDKEVWDHERFRKLARRDRTASRGTESIPPATWWPLMRAAWTYASVFSHNVLDLRDRAVAEAAAKGDPPKRERNRTEQELNQLVDDWLADPANLVPVHKHDVHGRWEIQAGAPVWTSLSFLITGGTSKGVFQRQTGAARKLKVLEAVERGQFKEFTMVEVRDGAIGFEKQPSRYIGRSADDLDGLLVAWLADPANLIPVRTQQGRMPSYMPGSIVWAALERLVYGTYSQVFNERGLTSRRRRAEVEAVLADDPSRVLPLGGTGSVRSVPMGCDGFAEVTRPDGSRGPWRRHMSAEALEHEIRMVRGACYVFTAGMTMMRDSEIQEIEKGALTTHYGSPAIVSRKIKKDPAQPQLKWWISEPVVEVLAVLERLTWHPTHLIVGLRRPDNDAAEQTDARRGIDARKEVASFIQGVNEGRHRTGLEEIPHDRVTPHMFRKTMSIICSQEPDSEIALGIQLKHVARRALANRVTQGYSQMDTKWAKEFDNQLELAAARRVVDLLKARRSGEAVAVGPGAAKLHAGLDRVIAKMNDDPQLRAQIADEQIETLLLRDEFANLHFGTVNHCIWEAEHAECEKGLPEDRRTGQPVLGACQPSRCRNSAITKDRHGPIWLAEDADLIRMLKDKKLPKPRREALEQRHAEVRLITRPWLEGEVT